MCFCIESILNFAKLFFYGIIVDEKAHFFPVWEHVGKIRAIADDDNILFEWIIGQGHSLSQTSVSSVDQKSSVAREVCMLERTVEFRL